MKTDSILLIVTTIVLLIIIGTLLFGMYSSSKKEKYTLSWTFRPADNKIGCYQDGCFPGQTEFLGQCWRNEVLNGMTEDQLVRMQAMELAKTISPCP